MTVLDINNLKVRRGSLATIQDVSFAAARNEVVALMGASGAGKTTVLRAIAGLEPLASGTIDINGLRLTAGRVPRGRMLRELHRRVGMVFQFHHLFAHLSALHNVWLAPVHVLNRPREEAKQHARALLEKLGVGDRLDAMPHELSGGEAQRVAIARALAVAPPVLLMDEPTASLDSERRGDLVKILGRVAGEGRTVLIATHDVDFARSCADRIVTLEKGRVAGVEGPFE